MVTKISPRPNAEQRKFILRKLIPSILRENGKNFSMTEWVMPTENWNYEYNGDTYEFDGIERKIPCGSVCCIGGTAHCLLYPTSVKKHNYWSERITTNIAKKMGLTYSEAAGLFFNWVKDDGCSDIPCRWPESFQKKFADRKSPLGKANVAANLLRKIANEGGKCLHGN